MSEARRTGLSGLPQSCFSGALFTLPTRAYIIQTVRSLPQNYQMPGLDLAGFECSFEAPNYNLKNAIF